MVHSRICVCILCAVLGLSLALGLLLLQPRNAAAQTPSSKAPVSFINDVAPIFKENCFACHDAKKRKGKLDMTTYENLRKGGADDDPITVGKPDESLLYQRVTTTGAKRMPPKDSGEPLPPEKIALIEKWISQGAKLDSILEAKADLLREMRIRWKPPVPPASYKYPININALTFTPDNKKLIAGGYHELTVWDVATGSLEKRIYTRAERAYAMVFLADGSLAVAGGRPGQEGDVRIYRLPTDVPAKGKGGVTIVDGVNDPKVMLKELVETDDSVLCLAISADGKKLASGGCDRLVRVWDLTGGLAKVKLEQTIENHADWIFGVAFSPDGKHLLTGSRDKTAKVWDLASKESVLTFPEHQNAVYAVGVSADGKIGYSVGEDNQMRTWNATGDGKQVRVSGGHGKAVFKVARQPKQNLLATCSADTSVRIWKEADGALVRTLSGHTDWVYALAISPDGSILASGSWNGEVKIWKIADGSLVKAFNASPGLQSTSPLATTAATTKK